MPKLNHPSKQLMIATGRAAGIPLDLIHAGISLMEDQRRIPALLSTATPALLLNQAAAARLLSVSRFTIRRLVAEGRIRPVKVRGAVRYRLAELEALAAGKAGWSGSSGAEGGVVHPSGQE